MSANKIVRKNIKMPLLKAFVCQSFGFVLYNYLSDPFLEAKILPENIANPVLAVVIAILCFLLQVYTDSSDEVDDYETTSRRSRRRKSSNKTESFDFMGPNRFSRTGMPEPTFFPMDVRDTVMSGSNIDELIYKMAAVERVLEQTAQSARASTVFAMPDIISVEREVYATKQNAAETENDVDATKPDIIAAEIHVEIATTGETVDDEEEQNENEESEVQGKENEDDDEEEVEETEEEKHEVKSDSAQEEEDACEEEEEENEAKSDSVQEEEDEEEEDEVTVIDALNKSKEKVTVKMSTTDETESEEENETNNEVNKEKKKEETKDESEEEEEEETNKSEDASKKNGDPRKKKGIERSAEKERDSEVKSVISVTTAPKTNENKPTAETSTPVSILHEAEVVPVVPETSTKEEASISSDILQDSAVEEKDISSKMVECSSDQKFNDVSILEEALKLITEIDESTVKSDLNANVPVISNGNEISSILSESINKEAGETVLDQPELSSVQSEKNTGSFLQETVEVIDKTKAIAASEFLSNIENSVSKGVETSLDKEAIKDCSGDEVINVAQMRKPANGVDVSESLKTTMTEQVSHNKVIDSPKSDEAKATLNGFDTESMLPTDDIKQTIPDTLEATDSEIKIEVILNGILPEPNSFSDEEMKEILNHDLEQSNSAEADSCEEGMATQSKTKELVLEQMNVPAINGFLPKSSDEINSKASASESLSDTPTETLRTLNNTPKEADVMKLPIQTKLNEDNNVSLTDNSTLHDEKNNRSTSSEKINEESKDAIESNSIVMELSTKEDNSTAIVMEMDATEETNVDVENSTFRQEAIPPTVLRDEEEIDVAESLITDDEKALLTEIEKSKQNLPAREASIVSEDVSKIASIPKTETAVGEVMYLAKQLPIDVSFLYRLPQNNSCDNCVVLNSKMDYVFKFLET
ncbi:hypothetical protein TNIN_95891 [Trichonephila inaurata madagascariensis]|uniref:Uncharacterized protein n=1 Tax=Trichonephila inaurata madagascariensis TaxID=2747483 RepID=A0A8X6X672_9ARAC|nr:hypothetical protein TNIN_95891 [Trichonephila inaurata madagascariensis]